MVFPIKFRPNGLYTKLLLAFTVTVTLLILILSFLLYRNYSNAALANENRKDTSILYQISYSMNYMDSLAQKFMSLVINAPNVSNLLYNQSEDKFVLDNALRNLDTLVNTNDYIYSVYTISLPLDRITSTETGGFYSTQTFYDQEIVSLLQKWTGQALSAMPIARRIPQANFPSQFSNVYTYVLPYQKAPGQKPGEAIVVNIKASALRELIASLNINKGVTGNDIVVIDSNGTVMNHAAEEMFLRSVRDEEYVRSVLSSEQPTGSFKSKIGGQSYNITFVSSEELKWRFISLTSYNSFMSPVQAVKTSTLITSLAILLLGLLFSFFVSASFYSLVRRLIDTVRLKSDELERKQRAHRQSLRNNWLKDIMLGHKVVSHTELQTQKEDLGIKTDLTGPLRVVLFRLDYYRFFLEKYNERERSLLKYGISNIIENVSSETFSCDSIEMEDDKLVLLLESAGSEEEETDIVSLTQSIQHSVSEYLHFSLSATVSGPIESQALLSEAYSEALALSLYRLTAGHGSILTPSFRSSICLDPSPFPEGKAKLLLASLKLGHLDKAMKYYDDIVSGLSGMTYEAMFSSFMQLMFIVSSSFPSVADCGNSRISNVFQTFYAKIDHFETLEEICRMFEALFAEIISILDENKHNKRNIVVNRIMKLIEDQYQDKSLNLSVIAKEFQMSNVYLGRLFKEETGKSIAEHITEVRMARVKELLNESNLSTREILDRCGWEDSNYFYTMFKKHFGVPLSQYRLSIQKKPTEE